MNIRTQKDKNNPYVQIHKGFLEDPNLSLKAKGLLAYCMSKPDDWHFHVDQLTTVLKEGRVAIRAAFKELIEHGYCKRDQERTKGQFAGCDYILSETKIFKKSLPKAGFPHAGFPNAENQPLLKNKNISIPKRDIEKKEPQQQDQKEKVVVVDLDANAKKLKEYLEGFSEKFHCKWKISFETLVKIIKKYGIEKVAEYVNYMTKQQELSLIEEEMPYKKTKTRKIDKPLNFLSKACAENWII